MFTALTKKSGNGKTGPIAVSTTSRKSCSPVCAFHPDNGGGCYAEAGYYTKLHWDAITAEKRGEPAEKFIASVAKLPRSSMFRHNVAGDLWHDNGAILRDKVWALADACKGLEAAWTYTHHLRTASNLLAIRGAIQKGLTVNLSTEVKSEAAKWAQSGMPTVCTVKSDEPDHFEVDGVKFHRCPATYENSSVQCANCGGGRPLCSRPDRSFVVTFPVHGKSAAKAAKSCG